MKAFAVAVVSLVLLFMTSVAALAKGPPTSVTIEGPGLAPLTLTDRPVLETVGLGRLEVWAPQSGAPVDLSLPSYVLTRRWTSEVWDRVRYYPVPDGSAYVLYETTSMTGGTQGKWFPVSPASDQALRQLIENPPAPRADQQAHADPAGRWAPIALLLAAAVGIAALVARARLGARQAI
jgi:hypothetical protein